MSEMLDYREWLMTRLSNYEEARDLFVEALRDVEETCEVDVFMSALDSIIEAQGKESKLAITVYLARAMTNFYLKQYDDAIADFDTVLELDPREKTALFGRNMAYSHTNGYDEMSPTFLRECLPTFDDVNTDWLPNQGNSTRQ